jgi:hypothetical protein
MFTDALPVEVTVTDFVTAVPTETSPNCIEEVLRLSAGVEAGVFTALSRNETLREDPFAFAEIVAVCALATAATVAVNEAVLEPAATVAAAGTTTELLVLASPIARAFDDFAARDAVHVVLPAPVKEVFAQESDFSSGAPTAVVTGERDMENDFATLR